MTEVETYRIKEFSPELIQPNTSTYLDPEQGGSKIIVIGKPGCFARDTEILLFSGDIKRVQNVNEGDILMGPDSKPRTVLELCRNRDRMFKILPDHGVPYTVNLKHKLVFYEDLVSKNIVEMTVEDYLEKPDAWKKSTQIFRASVEFPYVNVTDAYQQDFKNCVQKEYKINHSSVRLEVLANIIDTYGVLIDDTYAISCFNNNLQDDIAFISRSLGFLADIKDNFVYIKGNLQSIPSRKFLIASTSSSFHSNHTPFVSQSSHSSSHFFSPSFYPSPFSVIPVGEDDYYGFTIDGDHRFLLSTFDVVRNTGKTTLIASLLYAKKHIFPIGIAMSGTEDSNHFYQSIFPSIFVYNAYDEKIIESFIRRQKIAKEHLPNPWGVIITDDCTDNPSLFKKPLQQGVYKRGRHWKMFNILSLQYGMDVLPIIRTNVDGVFILREPNLRNRKVMYENYGGIIPSFDLFCNIMDQITDDYTALYIHNQTRTNDWLDCIYWYKASPIPKDFKFGCEEYWDFHYDRYNSEYVDPVII